jgi:NTE family protein
VYDNLGLEPALKEHDVAIVSDCGAPFPFRASPLPLLRHLRYPSVIMRQVQALRVRQLMSLIGGRGRVLRSGAYLGLGSVVPRGAPGYPPKLVRSRIAAIRTDLDRFTAGEQEVLINHGYTVAAARLAEPLAALCTEAEVRVPFPERMDPRAAAAVLRDSHRRVSVRRILDRG